MEQIRLQIFSDFADSTALKGAFKSWAWGKTEHKNLVVVDDDTFTHAVIYNLGRPNLKNIPKKNVLAFMHEPFELINVNSYLDYIKENIGTYICHDKTRFPNWQCFKEGICYLAPHLNISSDNINEYNGPKTHRMSIIASDKAYLPGHSLRHQLIRRILKTNMDIHIYGRGSHLYNDRRVKGAIDDKTKAFLPYQFSIAIENQNYPYWVTEKFYDPIIGNSIPLYWGASCVGSILGNESHISLPISSIDNMMDVIIDVYKNGERYNKNPQIVKQKLYTTHNYANYLINHFTEAN
jgi:hypothetical protein